MPYNANFSPQEKATCALWMAELGSPDKARRKFYRENGRKRAPHRSSVKRWYEQLKNTGFVVSQTKRGKKPTDQETVETVSKLFKDLPQISVRQAAQHLPLSKTTIHKLVRKEIKLYPYKIQTVHALREGDYERREEFARTMLGKIETDAHFLDSICFSDESTFHTSGLVHRHNVRIWGKENPRVIRQVERASPKVNVRCGLLIDIVIGPYFFEEDTVCQANFHRLLQEKVILELQARQPNVIFQLDGAPATGGSE